MVRSLHAAASPGDPAVVARGILLAAAVVLGGDGLEAALQWVEAIMTAKVMVHAAAAAVLCCCAACSPIYC